MTRSEPDNPTKDLLRLGPDLAAVLRQACVRAGLDDAGARLIHHYANVVCLLPAHQVVARINREGQDDRARTALHVTRWLTEVHGYPATAPLPALEPVVVDDSTVVTFWTYYPQPAGAASPDSAHLGRLVRALHRLPAPPVELPQWQPLESLHALTAGPIGAAALSREDQRWLLNRIDEVQRDLAVLDWPLGYTAIHGDAWAGNLLWDTASADEPVLLGDWDTACFGPREVDLIPSWHAAVRYGRGERWAQAFAQAYGYDLASWDGFPVLFAMRDLVQLAGPLRRAGHGSAFAAALRQRLDGIKADDRGQWREF
ncbi:phosphotransferase family protein [Lentzea flaviverrucosa]|uniref:Phosphotransferase enzyme family protein n=1 Tax=Lentzea flaviverrucosa TaxID=200379 RepID=A0A1H9EVN9_9PSEU|nr:aminoglycoside phosphotransferase family protein [Lentzea flaviverrucosa]RDI35383.1 phosphotransferase family enzyme [Lentzea flaviverrucosa]SEQ29711.1 Phosphotransferase enzyme family protein [Lentzea flaviverrucosa]